MARGEGQRDFSYKNSLRPAARLRLLGEMRSRRAATHGLDFVVSAAITASKIAAVKMRPETKQKSARGNGRRHQLPITRAEKADEVAIAALLCEAGLPSRDFALHLRHFLVARAAGKIVGVVGAEVYGTDALLRSFVVAPAMRGVGLGSELVRRLEAAAAAWGVKRWWLLTTTAETFFVKRGFRVVTRSAAPATILGTDEFRGLCPAAACLSRERREA